MFAVTLGLQIPGTPPGIPVFGVPLFCSLPSPASPLWVLRTGQFWETTHCPSAATPQTGNSQRREDIEIQLTTLPRAPCSLSCDLGLWGDSMDLPFWKSVAYSPIAPQLPTLPSAPQPRYFGRSHRKLLESTTKSFQDFMLNFCSESNPTGSSTRVQEDHLRLNMIHVGHCGRIINILGLCPWFLVQSS